MSSKIFVFAALALALSFSGAFILADDSDAADATIQLTVGSYYSNSFNIGYGLVGVDTDAPGMSVSTSGTTMYLSGTPSATGSYTATAYNEYEEVMWYADLIVSASPQPQTYTLTITCSPYAGGYVSDSSLTVTSGTSYSTSGRYLTVGSTTVTATATSGYAFDSWSSSSGTITSNKTITAYFESTAPTTYTCYLYYNANGGSGAPSTQSYTGSSTSSHTFAISATEPTRSGYVFMGWAESSGASTPAYQPGGYVSVAYNGSKTLYAVWNQTVAVTIHKSPASGGSLSTDTVNVPTGTSYSQASSTLTIGSNVVVASPGTGYAFDSWSPAGSGTVSSAMDFWAYFYATNTNLTFVVGTSYNVPLAVGQDAYDWGGGLPAGLSISWNSTDRCFYLTGTPTAADTGSVDILNIAEEVIGTFFITIVSNEYTVTINTSPAAGGTLTTDTVTVTSGTAYSNSTNTLTVGANSVVATPGTGYAFDSWSPDGSGTVTGDMTFWAYFRSTVTSPTFVQGTAYNVPLAVGPDADDWGGTVPTGMSISWNSTDRCFYLSGTPTAAGTSGVDILNIAEEVIGTFFFTVVSNDFTVTVHTSPASGGTVTTNTVTVPTGTNYSSSTNTFTIATTPSTVVTAVAASGFAFDSWSPAGSGTISADLDVWAFFNSTDTDLTLILGTSYNIPLAVGQDAYDWGGTVPTGMSISWNSTDRCFYLSGTPTAAGISGVDITDVAEQVIDTFFFTVVDPDPDAGVHWSNDSYNGKIDILFDMTNGGKSHTMVMDIYSMDLADANPAWELTDYTLTVTVSYDTGAHISAALDGDTSPHAGNANPGAWKRVLITIDLESGKVIATPLRTFNSFASFTLYDTQARTVLDFSKVITNAAVMEIAHTEDGNGNAPRFSVVSTSVFLDTYGVVMNNPALNVYDYFPQYEAVRLNLYSFALYGETMTINGTTWDVVDGKVTIEYIKDEDGNHLPIYDITKPVLTKTMALSNIYITWDGSRCSLTFVDDRFTIDLGTYNYHNETISFGGLWYFTTMIWDSSTGTEKVVGDWKVFPETSSQQMILIFMGILLLAGVAGMIHVRRSGRGTVDLIIIGAAMVVAFIMLGMWY